MIKIWETLTPLDCSIPHYISFIIALKQHNGVEKYAQYSGGYMQDSTYYRYLRDYQGNNVAVMDGSKNVLQESNYYPYGEPWREPEV